MLPAGQSLLTTALQRDVLLSYPYESMEPFLQMIREAANDPSVLSIRITIYRLAEQGQAGGISVRGGGKRQGCDRSHRAARPL